MTPKTNMGDSNSHDNSQTPSNVINATKTTELIKDNLKKLYKSDFWTYKIKIAPENDLLYEPFGARNPEGQDLVNSIREQGVHEPLILSAYYFFWGRYDCLAGRVANTPALLNGGTK
ncbi:MAG: hypothetical protein SCG84_01230 [Nitrosomonadaceae bacterium]|nr:hypothetical protein [Nitrosomonadaceae bacterium]